MALAASPAEIPRPPHRSLIQRAPDILVWGAVIVLLLISFGPVNMSQFVKLFTNSENMREYGKDFLHPELGPPGRSTSSRCG